MNIKTKNYIILLIFFSLFIFGIVFYKSKYFLIEIYHSKIYKINYSNIIKIENRIYYNKSLGLNHLDICNKTNLMKFNRKKPNLNSNILVVLILIYPDPFSILKSVIRNYIDIISREINFNFSLSIITCNNDISNLMIKNQVEIKLKFNSKILLNNIEIPNSECFTFVTYAYNKTIDVFYTDTKYPKFNESFFNKILYTSINNYSFSPYYAAGTNYYSYIPSHLSLFDYFDFFVKFDHDLVKEINKKINYDSFPLKKMIENNNYFFFGCLFMKDPYYITNNLYKTFFMFSLRQQDKCNYTILPTNLYKYDESIISRGAVNIGWLGFYSMLQIRYFSEEYLSAPYGLYNNRWGDQQFFIPILYGFNYENFSYFNNNIYLCSLVN